MSGSNKTAIHQDNVPRAPDTEGPALSEQDWDAIADGRVAPESAPENGDLRYSGEPLESLEEDDDNPNQESDEALPDDDEERAIADGAMGGDADRR